VTLPAKVHYLPTAGAIAGKFYLAGGINFNDGTSGRYIEAYNPVTDEWSAKALAPTARYAMAGAVMNNALYIAGGFTGTGYNNTLEVYDPRSDTWLTLTDMPTARGFLAAASLGGKLYAVGGRNESGLLTATEAYDPSVRR
jgi:N-acetylneuraminic acid mutarotase